MARDPRFDILFEPMRIGPKTARNRFYQVPHCTGMGRWWPTPSAASRGVKAEGGWAVVCTEQCDIHPSGNVLRQIRLWDEKDLAPLARTAEAIHKHGSLAGIELVHNGYKVPNFESRETPLAPSARPVYGIFPASARAMDKSDIRALRRWHRQAALNARKAGFDIVYVYAGHDLAMPMHFLSRRHNQRSDEYGGSLDNRVRLLRELLHDTHEAVGGSCAVALRFAVDELLGEDGITAECEGRDVVAMLAEIPDLWDVNISAWENDSQTSRFAEEGFQETYTSFVKSMTTKPVVGVGRYTSPDRMASLVKQGVLDFIGAARPSIADPFLPKKIEQGRPEDIRECIGCNVCVSGNNLAHPMRCTQNPTVSEEWRRGWHPERMPMCEKYEAVLVVGAGPAGLEAARGLGQRGYDVKLAEAGQELGGRVARECRLPGLATWGRVRDWRITQLNKMPNVEVFPGSRMTVEDVLAAECSVVAIATGSQWRDDGIGRHHRRPIPGLDHVPVMTPDSIMDGAVPAGPVVIYDDDHYYMGGVIAELLVQRGLTITLVTSEAMVSAFTQFTLEQAKIQTRLLNLGVSIITGNNVAAVHRSEVELSCVYTKRRRRIAAGSLVLVTCQKSDDALYLSLIERPENLEKAGIRKVARVGDALAPSIIAAAVWSGHRFAREIELSERDEVAFRRENVELASL